MSREKSPAKLKNPLKNRITGSGIVRVDDLLANPQNWRMHPDAQQQALAGVIDDVGFVRSILVNTITGHVVDGHARIAIAMRSGVEELPVEYVELSEAEEATVLATLDPIGAMAAADREKLDGLMRQVQSDDERVQALMADIAEREGLEYGRPASVDDPGAQVDRAEELRAKWGVEPGQLWQLGEHRLICGDCTDTAVVERVMGGERADTLVSDPPYGIGYEYDRHNDKSNEENKHLIMAAWELAPSAKVWTCGLMNLTRDIEWNPGAKVLCWHKGFAQAGNGLGGASTWEPVLVVGVKSGTLPNDYLHFGTDRIEGLRDLHSCPKPIALFEHLIEHLAGHIVYEPFSGSGTTLIACEQLGRRCRAVEISPGYVAVALERFYQATNKLPVLIEQLDA